MIDITNIASQIAQKQANVVARQNGFGRATKIFIGNCDKIIKHISYGYRKNTTGEYVCNKYRANFGWKNTYYQSAETWVMLKNELIK